MSSDETKILTIEEMEFFADRFMDYCNPKKLQVIKYTEEDGSERYGLMRPGDEGPFVVTASMATARALFSILVLCALASDGDDLVASVSNGEPPEGTLLN